MSDQVMTGFEIDVASSHISIDSAQNLLAMSIRGIDMLFTSEFELSSTPPWVHDMGTALVTVN